MNDHPKQLNRSARSLIVLALLEVSDWATQAPERKSNRSSAVSMSGSIFRWVHVAKQSGASPLRINDKYSAD
jgi:hypothetical protein